MSENLYSTPESSLTQEEKTVENEFYVVSIKKFLILYLSTLGFYIIYWFYKNWTYYKAIHSSSLWPVPRAIFSLFFVYSLCVKIDAKLQFAKNNYAWNGAVNGAILTLLMLASSVLDRMSFNEVGSPTTDLLSLAALPVLAYFFMKAQRAINISHGDDDGQQNSKLTGLNYLWIVLGLIFWALGIFGIVAMYLGL